MSKIFLLLLIVVWSCSPTLDQKEEKFGLSSLLFRLSKLTISGKAAKGTVRNAIVKVSSLQSNGECDSSPIAESKTDGAGNYSIEFRRTGGVVCVQVVPDPNGIATVYDEKSLKEISIPANSSFKLVNFIDESKIVDNSKKVPVSAITSMIANRVRSLAQAGTNISPAKLVKKAGKEVVIRFGLRTNISRSAKSGLNEADYPELIDLTTDLDSGSDADSKKYVTILAGFSELANSNKKGSELNAEDIQSVTDAFAQDMSSGKFDGTSVTGEAISFSGSGNALGDNSLSGTLLNSMTSFVNAGGRPGVSGPSVTVTTAELNQYKFNDTADIISEENYGLPSSPTQFSYNPASVVLNVNSSASLVGTLDATPTGCKISPNLPSGLTIGTDCTISGTPSATQAATNYTATAFTAMGSISTTVTILINPQKPDISYLSSNLNLIQNSGMSPISPNVLTVYGGGTVASCTSSPTLPTGLSINASCQISGTPSVAMAASSYTISVVDSFGSSNSTNISITIADTTLPTAPNPILTVTNNTGTSLTLSWDPATDNFSSSANIQYAVYYKLDETTSTNPTMNNVTDVSAETLVRNFSSSTSVNVTGLTAGKSAYWFNIVMMDEAGNKSVYTKKMVNTGVFILDCENSNGNFGGYAGVMGTSLCGNALVTGSYADGGKVKCNGVGPFISFSDKELKNAPTIHGFSSDLPVIGVNKTNGTRTQMFSNWSSLFTASPAFDWNTALNITVNVWTFTTADGSYDAVNNCSGGTSSTGNGTIGSYNSIPNWLTGNTDGCGSALTFLAICY